MQVVPPADFLKDTSGTPEKRHSQCGSRVSRALQQHALQTLASGGRPPRMRPGGGGEARPALGSGGSRPWPGQRGRQGVAWSRAARTPLGSGISALARAGWTSGRGVVTRGRAGRCPGGPQAGVSASAEEARPALGAGLRSHARADWPRRLSLSPSWCRRSGDRRQQPWASDTMHPACPPRC